MLVVTPDERPTINELLEKTFFKAADVTSKRRQGTLLALYASPSEVKRPNGQGQRRTPLQPLDLLREMYSTLAVLPRGEYKVVPATRFPEDVMRPLYDRTMAGISPRILHFSGHGDKKQGSLLFERADGSAHVPTPEELIAVLEAAREETKSVDHLECIFLNACETYAPLGVELAKAFPHLHIVAWDSKVADKAANTFGQAFYHAVSPMQGSASISDAFRMASAAFDAEWKWGNPFPPGGERDKTVHGCYKLIRPKQGWANPKIRKLTSRDRIKIAQVVTAAQTMHARA